MKAEYQRLEIRRNDDGSVDEIHSHLPLHVMLEQMDLCEWALIIDLPGDHNVHISLHSESPIDVLAEEDV